MEITTIPLVVFRPEVFYRWLYRQWHKSGGLSQASREAISEIHPLFAQNEFHTSTRHLLTVVDCAAVLMAVTEEDFISFVDWALDQSFAFPPGADKPTIPIGHHDLDISPARLRQQLARYYDQERLWPRQGFRPLLNEALSAASQAEKAMHLTSSAVTVPQRERAARQTHDGIDRSLLCAENFLERVIEFVAIAASASRVEGVDEERVLTWLKQAGIGLTSEDRRINWNSKQQCLQTIRNAFVNQTPAPESWEHFWEDLLKLLNHFRDGNPPAAGLYLLRELQQHRNAVRHASHTLLQAKTIPLSYKNAIPKIRWAIEELLSSSSSFLPAMAKIVEYRRDFTGAVELLLTTEERRLIVLRYDHEDDAQSISGLKLSDLPGRLVFASQEQEYFLFPPPADDTHLVVNALLLPSERPKEPVNLIRVRLPEIAVPAEFKEEAPV